MLNDDVKESIRESDILTDWDGVVIHGQNVYRQLYAYFSFLSFKRRLKFSQRLWIEYLNYKKDGDVSAFYSLFAGCPVEVIDETVGKNRQNERWSNLIEKLKLRKPGVVSLNNFRVILEDLNSGRFDGNDFEINMVAANKPEIMNGIYTGGVELMVNNKNLAEFVKRKDCICDEERKRILEDSEVDSIKAIKVEKGLWICTKRKHFIKSPLKSRNTYK